MKRTRIALLGSALLITTSGCMNPADSVANGVARLTIRNVGALATIINANTACGFSSPSVQAAAQLDGAVGGPGTLILTATDCEIDLGGGTEISRSCDGATTSVSGRVKISATRSVRGTLTGNATNPVVPEGPDAVTIELTNVSFTDFKVTASDSPNELTFKDGSVTATVKPRLAAAADTGACAISTPNVAFSSVKLGKSNYALKTADRDFEGTIEKSDLTALNGKHDTGENTISGTITLGSTGGGLPPAPTTDKTIPTVGDVDGLDPEYNADKFKQRYACTDNLASPESFECADLTPRLADGAARLTVKAFGTIASIVDKDTTCGFSSAAVGGAATINGTTGGTGSATFTVTNCEIQLPADTVASTDCVGVQTLVGGTVTVSGTKTVTGRLTGDAMTPVVPTSDMPAEISLTITSTDFRVGSSADANALRIKGGTLSGTLMPRTALQASTGACAISTPVARFENLTWGDAVLAISSESGTFDLPVTASDLNAVNGTWGSDSNLLSGTVTVGTTAHTVPSDGMGLNPAFNQTDFDAAYACTMDLVSPVSHACEFVGPLAQGAARLTPRTLGTVVSLVNANTTCGFSSAAVAGAPAFTGEVGAAGSSATFTIAEGSPCTLTFEMPTVVSTDCNGVTTTVQGTVAVSGTKVVRGIRSGDPLNPIVPTSRDPAEFDLRLTFTDFQVLSSSSTSSLTVNSGVLSGKVAPRTALDATTGACSISTPVVTFTDMTYDDADLTLVSDGRTFNLAVATSDLDAQNGTRDDVSNRLTGSITVDGNAVSIPVNPADNTLDPEFNQETFDSAYACTMNQVVPTDDATCSFQGVLAQGVARLAPRNVGAVVSLINANTTCGFSSAAVAGVPSFAGTTVGAPDLATFTLPSVGCTMSFPTPTVISTDCAGVETIVEGTVTVTGTKVVSGWRTGNPLQPVIPSSREPAVFTLDAVFDNFKVTTSASTKSLTIKDGGMSFTMQPRTALDTTTGACSVSTPVVTFTDIAFANANVRLTSDAANFDSTVGVSDLDAQAGTRGDVSNHLTGSITINGNTVAIPVNPQDSRLDPDFDQATHDASWACTPNMVVPADDAMCSFMGPLAQGAARLTPRTIGTVVSMINANTACGFSSLAVAGTPSFTGNLGDDGSTATFTIPDSAPCDLTFAAETTVSQDCAATPVTTSVQGTVRVHGTKVVTGFRTGDPLQPIVPTSRDPAVFNLTLEFTDFVVKNSASTGALTVLTGTLSGRVTPRVGLDTTTGACSISTPVVTFEDLTWSNAIAQLASSGNQFNLALSTSDLDAQNGTKDAVSNQLTGSITVNGAAIPIPVNPLDNRLDPAFDQSVFDASYACTTNLAVAPDEETCSFRAALAPNVARLLVKNVGVATKMVDGNSTCGFSAIGVLLAPTNTTGNPGEMGSVTWSTNACTVGVPMADTTIATNCEGGTTKVSGSATSTSSKTVTGMRGTTIPITPLTRTAATVNHQSLELNGFNAYDLAMGQTEPLAKLTVNGTVMATVRPILGQSDQGTASAGGTPVYAVSTPVSGFESISITNGTATLVSGAKTFNLTIDAADIDAFSGVYASTSGMVDGANEISGTITLDGQQVTILADSILDATFNQTAFDASYVCTPDLTEVVPTSEP